MPNPFQTRSIVRISGLAAIAASGLAGTAGPASAAGFGPSSDAAIWIMFVPLLVLMLAIIAEAVRLVLHNSQPASSHHPKRARQLSSWAPGHGEG